jgi:UDP-3-O-[3-hydroxymyristoyl] glucosamine N-acyltransferase
MTRIDQTAVIGHPPEQRGYEGPGWAPVIADSARIEAFVSVDAGTERATVVGAGVWLMKHVHIGHDAVIGPGCESPRDRWSAAGRSSAADVKVGATRRSCRSAEIGANARIGAGAVVTKDVPAGETWVGNPARKLEDWERDDRPHTERRACV